MSCIPKISDRVKALDILISSYRKAAGDTVTTNPNMLDFGRKMFMSLTAIEDGDTILTAADAQILMQLSEKYGESCTFRTVLPLVKKCAANMGFIVAFLTELLSAAESDHLRMEVVHNLFKDILNDVTADIRLQWETGREQTRNETAKRRRLDYDNHGSQVAGEQSPNTVTAEKLGTLFQHCEKLGLSHEINQLVETIVSQTPDADVKTFENLLLPLLQQLPPTSPSSKATDSHPYRALFHTVLSSYITTCVQPAPLKPTTWQRPPRGCSLYCEDCVKLDEFLKDAEERQGFFSVNGKRRDHIQEHLNKGVYGLNKGFYGTETLRNGTPFTLVVEKTGAEWENAMRAWRRRCRWAVSTVEHVGVEKVRGVLGEGWEERVGLVGIGGEGGERRPLGDLAQGKGMSGVVEEGVWTKGAGRGGAEIIDLSGE